MKIFPDKIFVTTGDPNEESVKTELIDLDDASNICSLPDYPMPLDGAIGGLVRDQFPVICGGYYYGDYYDDCVVIGNPELNIKLLQGRHNWIAYYICSSSFFELNEIY